MTRWHASDTSNWQPASKKPPETGLAPKNNQNQDKNTLIFLPKKQALGYNPTFDTASATAAPPASAFRKHGKLSKETATSRKDCTPNVRPNSLPAAPLFVGHFLRPDFLTFCFCFMHGRVDHRCLPSGY
ncbi:MAG: hypothetical protein V4451_13735 [Pseudomonadota bacterium]